jgi:hypothetical protein
MEATLDGPADHHGKSSGMAEDEAAPELLRRLLDLPAELLVAIATQLAEDDELAASLACRKLRKAVAGTEQQLAGAQLSTSIGSALVSVDKLEWAASCGMPLSADLLTRASRLGQLEPLRWLRAHGCAWEASGQERTAPCSSAAAGGHLSVLQWARADGCPWDERTCEQAAEAGHLHVLRWAHANGCPWDTYTCASAALGGHLEVLQWLRANGCPWDTYTCTWAAGAGHLAVLQWARANGCPWKESTCAYAAMGGHLEVLQWARTNNGCPWDANTCLCAAGVGHLDVLQWARANGCPEDEPAQEG